MGEKCNGCDTAIYDLSYMKCSNEKCKRSYHLKCLAMTEEKFQGFSDEYKNNWSCPECSAKIPKGNNSDTPVRGHINPNKTVTPSNFVNIERGSRCRVKEIPIVDNECNLLKELMEFCQEVRITMKEQILKYEKIQYVLNNTVTELNVIKNMLKVVQEKADKVDELENTVKTLTAKNEQLENRCRNKEGKKPLMHPTSATKTYANTLKHDIEEVVPTQSNIIARTKECGATKSETSIGSPNMRIKEKTTQAEYENNTKIVTEEDSWTEIKRKKSKYPNNVIKRGGNTKSLEIQGTERKKYLHVWRLKEDATLENLKLHVKKICGRETAVTVEKIMHKTKKDYASFIIGVPEMSEADLYAITETGCNESIYDAEFIPMGYKVVRCDRADGPHHDSSCDRFLTATSV
ncbi:hypothetical protein ACJJTC_015790 [Scirpophaga incertulas]